MRTLAAASFLLRRVRAEAGALALIWLVVTLTAFVFAAAPRVFASVADAALRSELADAPAVRRGIDLAGRATLGAADRPGAALDRQTRQHAGRFPDSVRSLIGDSVSLASSPRFAVAGRRGVGRRRSRTTSATSLPAPTRSRRTRPDSPAGGAAPAAVS